LQGWQNPEGDEFFKTLREHADHPGKAGRERFYKMNKNIGMQLAKAGAFTTTPSIETVHALNLCMAPGGYTWSLLEAHQSARISGITLPVGIGGHPMVLPYGRNDPRVQVEFMDITMMAPEFGTPIAEIPPEHPEAASFSTQVLYQDVSFDIVLCDGNVLRTHKRAEYRQGREALRLTVSQLIFGMKRIKTGGTFIILLHKADAWVSVELLQILESFSKIQLFKPARIHAQRSSFYVIAKDVQPKHPKAIEAIQKWQKDWWRATFAGKEHTGEDKEVDEQRVYSVLDSFGPKLIELGRPIWKVQLDALRRASYTN
jgi:23S rRNA U2552 (ribose-2'-O)-methylase RlmE/FtsJ